MVERKKGEMRKGQGEGKAKEGRKRGNEKNNDGEGRREGESTNGWEKR